MFRTYLSMWQSHIIHGVADTVEYVDEWFGPLCSRSAFAVCRCKTLNRFRKWFDNIPFYGLNIVLIVMLMMVDGGKTAMAVLCGHRQIQRERVVLCWNWNATKCSFVYFSRIALCVSTNGDDGDNDDKQRHETCSPNERTEKFTL